MMASDETAVVALPGGFAWEGKPYQEAQLRALTGRDEAVLWEQEHALSQPHWSTTVLERGLAALGPLAPVPREAVRALTVGDREALLLHLRRLTLGDAMPCVLHCPSCEEKMDLTLSASELLLPSEEPSEQSMHTAKLEENGRSYRVRFRLPTGGDQEAISELGATDPQAAADWLVRRCVDHVTAEDETVLSQDDWSSGLVERLSEEMEALEPQAQLKINAQCAFCDHAFSFLFDTATYFAEELARRGAQLYREVHTLALYYHWSEQEILGLTLRKRARYIDLINESISEARYS